MTSKKKIMKTLSAQQYWCRLTVRCNPLESSVNLWARGTVCWQFVLSDHCVMYVSVSPVSLPVWTQMSSSSGKCASLSNSSISSTSRSVRFHPVSILPNALWCNSSTHQTHRIPNDHDSSICTAWPVTCNCPDMGWNCGVTNRGKHEPQSKKIRPWQQNERHLPLVPYCTNQSSACQYAFLSSPTDYIWTHLPQQPDKPALPQNPNIIIGLKPKLEEIRWQVQSATNFIAQDHDSQQELFETKKNK